MLTDVSTNLNIDTITKAIIAICLFVIGLLVLFIGFIVVKNNTKDDEINTQTNDEKINRLYFLYETKQITEQELKMALDKLLEEGKEHEEIN